MANKSKKKPNKPKPEIEKSNNETITQNLKDAVNILTPVKKWNILYFKDTYLQFDKQPKLIKYFNDTSNDINLLYGSHQNRMNAFISFAYYMDIDIVNTICATFKITDISNDSEAIFAFGYYQHKIKVSPIDTNRLYKVPNSNIYMSYFVLGGSLISKDGEYRSRCVSPMNLYTLKKHPTKDIIAEISGYFKKILPSRNLLITKDYFYPTDDKKISEHNLEYYSYILQYDLFSITWFNLMFNLNLNIIENNLNDSFQLLMLKHKNEDLIFFQSLLKKYSNDKIEMLRILINNIKSNSRITSTTKIGQKIIPLSISEVQHPFNIRYKSWREYLISLHLSDYVINYISPGFFITNQWFYIKNARKGLFDNIIQYEKMERSELAEQIANLLIRAQLYTHENIQSKKKFIKKTQKTIESWMSEKFKILSDKIQDPIDYSKEEIIMSNVALCFMSEYVGRTIMDVLMLCKTSKYYNTLIGEPFTQKGFPFFNKYMFDICYNLYCMNRLSGILHGDLHLNNVTLNPILYRYMRDINNIKDPMVLYVLGDKEEQYLLPTVSYNSCIIDFSRSIILPNKIDELRDKSLPKSYSIIGKLKDFQNEQVERLLKIYIHYTSDSAHNKDELRIIFRNKFEAVFKLLSITDIYGFTQKLLMVFKIKDSTIIVPHKSCIELIAKINAYAQYYITTEMNKLISTQSYEETILNMEWPIYTIIKKTFFNNLVSNTNIGNIVDVFNINNPIKFSLTKISLYPTHLIVPKRVLDGKVTETTRALSEEIKQKIAERTEYEDNKAKSMKMINYIALRHKEKKL